jgi:DNA-binding beta-propeller fold protein YncE
MMCAVRSPLLPLAAAVTVVVGVFLPAVAGGGSPSAFGAAPPTAASVRTLVGPGVLDAPTALAFDATGDLFVADSGHCRVAVVPARNGSLDGLRLRTGRVATLVGGSCRGPRSIGHPTGLAVDAHGDVFIAEATAQRVQVVREGARPTPVTVAGTGRPGFTGNGQPATDSDLNQPTAVAVDAAGDLFIADTANCLVRVVAAHSTTLFGEAMTTGDLYTVAGVRVCGTAGQGGPLAAAHLWDPVAVAIDPSGTQLLVADRGDQSVLLATTRGATYWGTPVAAGDIGVVVGGTGSYGPYLADGLSANGGTAELNDPRGVAVGPAGALLVTDGFMHALRMVPATDGTLFGQTVKSGAFYTLAGALPVSTRTGAGNGTRWVRTHADTPSGVALSPGGNVVFSDAGTGAVRMVAGS